MKSVKNLSIFQIILILFGGLILLFVVAPILSMCLSTSVKTLVKTAAEEEVYKSIWLTLWTSMVATIVFSILAVPFAYLLARKDFPFKRLICGIIDVPIVIPHSAAGIALLGVVSRNSIAGEAASKIGINFIDHPIGIMIAMAFVSLPFLINGAREGFESVPLQLEKTAYTLGASQTKVFFTISIPLAWRAILSGFVMMWGRGLSEFGTIVIIAYYPMVTAVLIYNRFTAYGLKYAQPVAVLFVIACLIIFIFLRLLSIERKKKNNLIRYK
ncbi:MAG TPA: ABC transporter permease [Victivallales bacterium]|nr:ABC transporter permease [Victivallales bacterium]